MESHTVELFPFQFDRRYQLAGLVFGITPATACVRVTASELSVEFGPWRLRTARNNVVSLAITGPYELVKTMGPPHLSLADGGLACVTNPDRGLCIVFDEPAPGIEPTGLLRHSGVTVTVTDCERLAAELE